MRNLSSRLFSLVGAFCPFNQVEHATPETSLKEPGDHNYFQCDQGYEFPSGDDRALFVCQDDAKWLPEKQCHRKKNFHQLLVIFFTDIVSTVQCDAVQCGAVRCGAVRCGTVQCSD